MQQQQPPSTTAASSSSLLSPEELEALQEFSTQLQEARDLHKQTTDPSDREELSVVIEELEEQMKSSLEEIASTKIGIKVVDEAKMAKELTAKAKAAATAASSSLSSSVVIPANHLLKWEGDNKLYSCNVTSLFFEGNDIKCNVTIPGFPENNRKNEGKGDVVSLSRDIVGNWDQSLAFIATANNNNSNSNKTDNNDNCDQQQQDPMSQQQQQQQQLKIIPGEKCFAVDVVAASSQEDFKIFIPCIVERLTLHSTVWVAPIVSTSTSTSTSSMPAYQRPSFEVPLSHVRPYGLPPAQGKMLRKKWENLNQEEKNQIVEEKKKKQQEQQEKQRRQRSETISNQANDWNKMKALMGGRGGGMMRGRGRGGF